MNQSTIVGVLARLALPVNVHDGRSFYDADYHNDR